MKIDLRNTKEMEFKENSHSYIRDGYQYISVSEFLDLFKPPFKKEEISKAVAQREGVSQQFILNKWDLNSKISQDYGNAVHKGIEYWINYGESNKLKHIKKVIKEFSKLHDRENLMPEQVLYCDTYGIAGTIDQIEIIDSKNVNIVDVKTNHELSEKSYGKYLPPLEDLEKHKINDYTLQLSMYKYLIEINDVKVNNIMIEHWDGSKFNTIHLEPIDIKVLLEHEM